MAYYSKSRSDDPLAVKIYCSNWSRTQNVLQLEFSIIALWSWFLWGECADIDVVSGFTQLILTPSREYQSDNTQIEKAEKYEK